MGDLLRRSVIARVLRAAMLATSIVAAAGACGPETPNVGTDDAPAPQDRAVPDEAPPPVAPTGDPGKPAAPAVAATPSVPFALPPLRTQAEGPGLARADVEVWIVLAVPDAPGRREVVGPLTAPTDAAGVATVQLPGRGAVAHWWARSGERWWRSGLEPQDAPELVLGWGDRTLVRVVDHRGAAVAGVGVSVQTTHGPSRSSDADSSQGATRTDAAGFVLLTRPGPQRMRDGTTLPPPPAVVQVELPIVPAVAAPMTPGGPGPLVLRVPECGSVRVTVASDDLPETATVLLAPLVEGSWVTGFTPATSARIPYGVAEFPQVGAGLRFAATLQAGDREVTTRIEFAGPAGAGSRVEVPLPRGGQRPSLTGRLLSEDGVPRTGESVIFSIAAQSDACPWMAQTHGGARVGPDGRFRATLDLAPDRLSGALVTVQQPVQPSGMRTLLSVRAPRVGQDGTADLGDIRPEALPVFVAGRAFAADGSPLQGASIHVMARPTTAGKVGLKPQRDLTGATAEDGTFTIRGKPASEGPFELRLHCSPRALAAPVAFEAGATDVVVRAMPTGSATVRLVLPEGLAEASFCPVFEGEPAVAGTTPIRGTVRASGLMHGGGVFAFDLLTPGTGWIAVYLPGDDGTPIARIDGVEITAGGRTDAGVIDLQKIVPVATVRVTDADGKPALDGGVWWTGAGTGSWREWRAVAADRDGCARIPVVRPVQVLARRPGSRFAGARRVTGDVTLSPMPAREIPVTVRLADGVEIPEAPYRFEVTLKLLEDDAPPGDLGSGLDPRNYGRPALRLAPGERSVLTRVTEPGRWCAVLMLYLDRGGSGYGHGITHQGADVVVVTEDAASAEILVHADAAEIARTRASLAGQ